MLRSSGQPVLESVYFSVLFQSKLCHLVGKIIDIHALGLNAPFFCNTDQLLRILYLVGPVRSGTAQSLADRTAVIGMCSSASCCETEEVASYDTMSVTSANASRGLRCDAAGTHCTDTAADALLAEFTMRSLILDTHLPSVCANFCASLEKPVCSGLHFFKCCEFKVSHSYLLYLLSSPVLKSSLLK